jgi:hypothetical protein
MLSNFAATTRSLVYQPHWDIDGMTACCGANVLLRLEASYCNGPQRREQIRRLQQDNFRVRAAEGYLNLVNGGLHSTAHAIPYNMAMAAVLQDMMGEGPVLWICTDNILPAEGGDVHQGPFSTREMTAWLPRHGLADVYQGSTNGPGRIKTWSWTLDLPACAEYLAEQEEAIHTRFVRLAEQLPGPEADPDYVPTMHYINITTAGGPSW